MQVDLSKAHEQIKSDVERHNKIFLFKYKERIDALEKKYKKLGKTKYKLPIVKDEQGRLMWVNRKERRKGNIR